MTHLWEVDHPYYCSENNYFSSECHQEFDSWQDFIEEEGDADLDMNLVFRFDWVPKEHEKLEQEDDEGNPFQPDSDVLQVFFVGQRKGLFRSASVKVNRQDEESVKEYLKPRLAHLMKMWEPLT
jgi:hypothetical protein